jgi:ribonucleotide reductase beta subunit family protein with ferritin-like domain
MCDPILEKDNRRFTMFPIQYPDLWELYKKSFASLWTVEEIDLSTDHKDWEKLTQDEKHFIKTILAFFAASDGIVFENVNLNFLGDVQISEARAFYAYQCCNEMVHSETYSLMIDKLVTDANEKQTLFNAIENIPCVKKKAEWALKWFDQDLPFSERLLSFACVEGIFFSGSFCAIFWLKNRGIMPGLCFSNELISRDEGLHQEFALALFSHLKDKPSKQRILEIVQSAIEIEKEFVTDALPVKLIGMDSEKMTQYIEFIGMRLLRQLGLDTELIECPFDWMQNISLDGKTNFFEKRVGEYSKYMPESGDGIRFDATF